MDILKGHDHLKRKKLLTFGGKTLKYQGTWLITQSKKGLRFRAKQSHIPK
jgi:hypothetical protein